MAKRKQTFKDLELVESYAGPLELTQRRFDHCAVGMRQRRPATRLNVSNVVMRDCEAVGCFVGPVVFEDCTFTNVRSKSPVWVNGAAFIRCRLEGKVQGVMAFALWDHAVPSTDETNAAIYADNQRIYSKIAWALDLTEADCHDVQFRGIPIELIKVRSGDQVKVSYERACRVRDSFPKDSLMFRLLDSELCGHSVTQTDFVIATCPTSSFYADTMEIIETLARHGALIDDK